MAWDLLTNVYKLDPSRLYVTYYAGGSSIPVDEETKRIWESMGWMPIYSFTEFDYVNYFNLLCIIIIESLKIE